MPLNAIVPAVPGQVIAAAYFNEQGPEQISAIEAGTAVLAKVTLDGAASDPAVSAAAEAVVSYNTTEGELRQSLNGSPFESLGRPALYADATYVGGTVIGVRS